MGKGMGKIKSSLGIIIKSKIKSKELTLKKVAETAGINYSHLCNILQGKRTLHWDYAFRIGKVLNLSPLELMIEQVKWEYSKLTEQSSN